MKLITDRHKMTKAELLALSVELENEIHRLEKELPNVKTDEYIKKHRNKVEPFKFSYTVPYSDWFETKNVVINYDDYYYFHIQRRFGPSWWLVGSYAVDMPAYHWKEFEIGKLSNEDLKRFIKWARSLNKNGGNPIIEIKVISGSFDIFKEIKELEE